MPKDESRADRENAALDALIAGLLSDIPVEMIGEPPAGLMGSHAVSNGSTWTTATQPNMADLTRQMQEHAKSREQDDRKVFVFDGTPDEFFAECRRQGVIETPADSLGMGGPSGLVGMEVIERHGKTFVGTREAIRRLLDGPPRPDIRRLMQASWKQHEEAYRYLSDK